MLITIFHAGAYSQLEKADKLGEIDASDCATTLESICAILNPSCSLPTQSHDSRGSKMAAELLPVTGSQHGGSDGESLQYGRSQTFINSLTFQTCATSSVLTMIDTVR